MATLESLQLFFGWCTVINSGVLLFTTAILLILLSKVKKIHAKLFNLSEEDVCKAYFQYLAQLKIAVIVFNIVPYIALKIMG